MEPPGPLPANSTLILLGTVHGDPRGFARCLHSLQFLRPDLIFVELSPFARSFREDNASALHGVLFDNLRAAARKCLMPLRDALTHPEINAVRRQISLPFEYRAARRFSRATGSTLLLVDQSPFSRKMIERWPELLAAENLASLLALPRDARPAISRMYDSAARIIRAGGVPPADLAETGGDEPDRLWEERERYLAGELLSLMRRHCPSKPVYLGGWRHLCTGGSFPSLRELLQIDLARCVLLDRGFLRPRTHDRYFAVCIFPKT